MNDHVPPALAAGSVEEREPVMVLRVPARLNQNAVVRAAVAGVCAQWDLPVDALDDVKLAVNEVFAMSVEVARPGTDQVISVTGDDDRLVISVVSEVLTDVTPSRTSFGWIVVSALVDEVNAHYSDGELEIRLTIDCAARRAGGADGAAASEPEAGEAPG